MSRPAISSLCGQGCALDSASKFSYHEGSVLLRRLAIQRTYKALLQNQKELQSRPRISKITATAEKKKKKMISTLFSIHLCKVNLLLEIACPLA